MKLRIFSLGTLACGIIMACAGILAPMITGQRNNIEIIGGADLSTYLFVAMRFMNGWPFALVLLGAALVLTALVSLLFSRTVAESCSVKTSGIAFGLAATGACGIQCFFFWYAVVSFHETAKYPIAYPASVIFGMLFLVAFLVLFAWYCKERKNQWSAIGMLMDVGISSLYLPVLFILLQCLLGAV